METALKVYQIPLRQTAADRKQVTEHRPARVVDDFTLKQPQLIAHIENIVAENQAYTSSSPIKSAPIVNWLGQFLRLFLNPILQFLRPYRGAVIFEKLFDVGVS